MEELSEYVGSVGAVSNLHDGGKDILELQVVIAFEIGAISSFEDCVGDISANFHGDDFDGTFFGPNHAWWMRLRRSALS